MRIRSGVLACAAVAIVVTVLISVGLALVTRQADRGLDEQAESQQVARQVSNMLSLTNEFTTFGGERSAAQWRLRHDQLVALVQRLFEQHVPPPAELEELRRDIADLRPLFEKLVELGAQPPTPLTARRRELLLERLLTETQEVVESRFRWAATIARQQREDQRLYTAMVVGAPAVLLLLLVALGWLVARRVLRPLERLRLAAEAIRAGDLQARCANDAPDELGAAARAVDAMAAQLAANERLLLDITANVPALIAYIDRDHCYRFANLNYRQWLGADETQMIGRHVRDAVSAEFFELIRPRLEAALAGERTRWERRSQLDGQEQHLLADYIPDVGPDGTVRGCYALTIDITERRRAEMAVAQSEQRMHDLMSSIPAIVAYFDMDERCQYANDAGLKTLGIEATDIPGIGLRQMLGEGGYHQHERGVREAVAGRRARLEGQIGFDGREAHYQSHLIPDRTDDGGQRGFYLMTFDITALKEAQHEQARVERQLRGIADNLPVLITHVNPAGRYTFVNATVREWLGIEPQALIGQSFKDTMTAQNWQQRREHYERAMAGERVDFEVESVALGITRSLHSVYLPDRQADGSLGGIITLTTDVTQAKRLEQDLRRLARIDGLTGLPNRRHFEEKLAESVSRARRQGSALALFFLDIDHFKSINDSRGHAVGDEVLKAFGQRLKACVRSTDTPARLAGDEFVVVLEALHDEADAVTVAEKIVSAMRLPIEVDGHALHVTTSIGIAYCARPGPGSALMEVADAALYDAKRAGRNGFGLRPVEAFTGAVGEPERELQP